MRDRRRTWSWCSEEMPSAQFEWGSRGRTLRDERVCRLEMRKTHLAKKHFVDSVFCSNCYPGSPRKTHRRLTFWHRLMSGCHRDEKSANVDLHVAAKPQSYAQVHAAGEVGFRLSQQVLIRHRLSVSLTPASSFLMETLSSLVEPESVKAACKLGQEGQSE